MMEFGGRRDGSWRELQDVPAAILVSLQFRIQIWDLRSRLVLRPGENHLNLLRD